MRESPGADEYPDLHRPAWTEDDDSPTDGLPALIQAPTTGRPAHPTGLPDKTKHPLMVEPDLDPNEADAVGKRLRGVIRTPTMPTNVPEPLLPLINDIATAGHNQDSLQHLETGSARRIRREQLVVDVAEIMKSARDIARQVVVDGVLTDEISRVEAGRILGVHQGTIARWVKGASSEPLDNIPEPADKYTEQWKEDHKQ